MANGTIKRIVNTYGFIRPSGGGDDVFFHKSEVQGVKFEALREGDEVTYEPEMGPRGLHATKVQAVGKASAPTKRAPQGYRFINPYNFIRLLNQERPQGDILGDAPPMPHDRYVGLSGKITCQVTTETPLFISDSHAMTESLTDEDKVHPSYRFFEYDGDPALPASSLRGMIRSLFEAVTNACFPVFDGDRHLEYRERPEYGNEVKSNAGLVVALATEDTKGAIVLCQTAKVGAYYEGKDKWKDVLGKRPDGKPWQCGDYVAARVKKVRQGYVAREIASSTANLTSCSDGEEYVEGWLKITGKGEGTSKKSESLFLDPTKHRAVGEVTFTPAQQKEYNRVLAGQLEREDLPVDVQSKTLQERDLVWVETQGRGFKKTAKHIVRVQVPRIPYQHTIKELALSQQKCDTYTQLCPACRVFGWVHTSPAQDKPQEKTAYASRVYFNHGKFISGERYPTITLSILSSPNPTTPQFYLVDQEGKELATIDYDTSGARLRGRKFYRHHGEAQPSEYATDAKSDQNRTVRGALKPGARFSFEVEFESLTAQELGALLYALELEEGLFHRLGYAKPLGFGSVKIEIESVRVIDMQQRYASPEATAGWKEPPKSISQYKEEFLAAMRAIYGAAFDEVLEDIRHLASPPATSYPIHYPRPTQQLDMDNHPPFEWFVGNKSRVADAKKRRRSKLPQPVALPVAPQDDEGLPLIRKDGHKGH